MQLRQKVMEWILELFQIILLFIKFILLLVNFVELLGLQVINLLFLLYFLIYA
jgi:hypothetical protein